MIKPNLENNKKNADANVKRSIIVVPNELKAFVIYLHHNFLLGGHQGRKRTTISIEKAFWWRGMSGDVRRWIKSCVPCKRRKTPRPLRSGLTMPVTRGCALDTVAIDLVGPCPETANGDVWILTMIDVFTRWPIAVPISNRNATTIIEAIYKHLVCEHGMPCRLLSDRGKEFIDQGLVKMCAMLGISKVTTTGYQPQANGHVERLHKYMNVSMTILSNKKRRRVGLVSTSDDFFVQVQPLRIDWILTLFPFAWTSPEPSGGRLVRFEPHELWKRIGICD